MTANTDFKPAHCGLYFNETAVMRARKNHKRPPLDAAWMLLRQVDTPVPDGDVLAAAGWDGLRWCFDADDAAGARAVAILEGESLVSRLDQEATVVDNLRESILLAQSYELLRNHPSFEDKARAEWLGTFYNRAGYLNERTSDDADLETRCWLAAFNIAAGVVLERADIFELGTAAYRGVIDNAIHPEGYMPGVVESAGYAGLSVQLSCVAGLVLAAEAADHAGGGLWRYEKRSVSVLTAATYPLYYYFYPEKWPWRKDKDDAQLNDDAPLEQDAQDALLASTQALFRAYGGFLEIINRRYDRPLKAVTMILDELRPVYDPYGGGLTTLSHAEPVPRGLFG